MATTLGQFLINENLPAHLRTEGVVDKKELHKKLYEYAREDPVGAAKSMDNLRVLGHEIATTEGITISLDDITPDYAARNAVTRPALSALNRATSQAERQKIIDGVGAKMMDASKGVKGSQALLVNSGAKGKQTQIMRMMYAPVAPRTESGGAYPWLIHHSFSEGLRPSEMLAANIETRNNLISSFKSVVEPGDFSKILVNNMNDQLVLSEDCGTKNGVMMQADDSQIIDRYLAKSAGSFPTGTLITPQVYSRIKKSGGSVQVRSPMTCELGDGICQKCYGLNERGNVPKMGTNLGVRSAQALTEPLTQVSLSAKHGVQQAVVDRRRLEGLAGLRNFLEMPQSFANKAVLAPVAGKVSKIEKAPQGGEYVYLNDEKHYVPPHLPVVVKKNQAVTPGDALSSGVAMPNEIVQYKGLGEGRQYVVGQLQDLYKQQGIGVDRRHLELLAKTHMNLVRVDNDPEQRFLPGEVVRYNSLLKTLREDAKDVPVDQAIGKTLAAGYMHHTAGTVVTPDIAQEIKKNGYTRVTTAAKPPEVTFIAKAITRNPLMNPDWMARLGHRYLKESILEGAHLAQESNLHGTHPVPAFAYGAEFGEGKGGRY